MEVARHRGTDDLWLAPGLVRRHCAWRIDRDFADGARLPGADARVSQAASRAVRPMLLPTIHGFAAVEPRLYEVARLLGLSHWEVIRKIALPNAMPDILAGMRLGLTGALILPGGGGML